MVYRSLTAANLIVGAVGSRGLLLTLLVRIAGGRLLGEP